MYTVHSIVILYLKKPIILCIDNYYIMYMFLLRIGHCINLYTSACSLLITVTSVYINNINYFVNFNVFISTI